MYIHLLLSGFWLAIGVSLLIYHRLNPDAPLEIMGSGISAGWLGIVFALYNMARWWSAVSYAKNQEFAEDSADKMRERQTGDRQKYRSLKVENPEFDFTRDENKDKPAEPGA